MPRHARWSIIAALAVAFAGLFVAVALAGPPGPKPPPPPQTVAVYDSTISPLPGNIPSFGVEAYAFNQIGNEINLATPGGPPKQLNNVVVTMSSWHCEAGDVFSGTCVSIPGHTYSVPITFTIYNQGASAGTVGSVIATRTQTFDIPYRTESDDRIGQSG